MFPIADHNPTTTRPVVNYALLVANILVFVWQQSMAARGAVWVEPAYGVVPARLLADPLGEAFTITTSMFMHGGLAHLGGNMLFLYIFGDNVEDALGHVRYILFYVLSGIAAAAAQILVSPGSTIPMVGASGAIAGVLGAYLLLYPRAPVTVLFVIWPIALPAWLVVGEWFLWNLFRGFGSIGHDGGGVAFFAHIGGFVAGLLCIRPMLAGRRRVRPERWSGWKPPPKRPPPRSPFGDDGPFRRPPPRDPWN
jgi:membrane associated rhomboid family serine protease